VGHPIVAALDMARDDLFHPSVGPVERLAELLPAGPSPTAEGNLHGVAVRGRGRSLVRLVPLLRPGFLRRGLGILLHVGLHKRRGLGSTPIAPERDLQFLDSCPKTFVFLSKLLALLSKLPVLLPELPILLEEDLRGLDGKHGRARFSEARHAEKSKGSRKYTLRRTDNRRTTLTSSLPQASS
jgi:hypothetical protein